MAQKNFFAIVTLIACLLAFAPTEVVLVGWLSSYANFKATLVANIFGIIAATVLIYGIFSRYRGAAFVSFTAGWAALNGIIAALYGWSILGSFAGGAVVTSFLFALFVIAIIRYEDLERART